MSKNTILNRAYTPEELNDVERDVYEAIQEAELTDNVGVIRITITYECDDE